MPQRRCDNCRQPFTPRQVNGRFCCQLCANAWFADERRRGVELLRQTYYGQSLLEAEDHTARYAGVGAVAIGQPLPMNSWHIDPVPQELPLGIDINEVPEEARS